MPLFGDGQLRQYKPQSQVTDAVYQKQSAIAKASYYEGQVEVYVSVLHGDSSRM